MPLSDNIIDNTETRTRPLKLFGGDGLYVLINPNGIKYLRLKFRFAGTEKSISLGLYPEVSLGLARARTHEARRLLRAGSNPSDVRRSKNEAPNSEFACARYAAKATDEVRSLRVSVLEDRTIEVRMGRASLSLTEQRTRHLEQLLSWLPKRKPHADATH